MTEDELSEIEARAEAALPGPWFAFEQPAVVDDAVPEYSVCSMDGPHEPTCPESPHCHRCVVYSGVEEANAEFIAAARTAVPALVAEVRRLTARVARLETACEIARPALKIYGTNDAGEPVSDTLSGIALVEIVNALKERL